jgi:release factor glutamine methyltransferase
MNNIQHPTLFEKTKSLWAKLALLYSKDHDGDLIAWQESKNIVCYGLDLTPVQWLALCKKNLSPEDHAKVDGLIQERLEQHKPLHRIQQGVWFWKHFFAITPHTLAPRWETEGLVDLAIQHFQNQQSTPKNILDLGTGSGCILLSLMDHFPESHGIGVDISLEALTVSKKNADTLGLGHRLEWHCSSWGQDLQGNFDCIISNPPYIPHQAIPYLAPEVQKWDPLLALDGGYDGMEPYRILIPRCAQWLAPGGIVIFEIGQDQEQTLLPLMESFFPHSRLQKDLRGIQRYLIGNR